ncbi:MAG: hypothetical protein OXG39_18315 [Chloroflexi bacterium]|nr:hypothetical protein [Chloroflexota bacterium]
MYNQEQSKVGSSPGTSDSGIPPDVADYEDRQEQRLGINKPPYKPPNTPTYVSDVDDYERRQEERLGINKPPSKPAYMSDVEDYEDRQEQRLGIKKKARNSGQSGVVVDQKPDLAEQETGGSESQPTSTAPVLKPLTVGQRIEVEVRMATENDEDLRGVLSAILVGLPPDGRFQEFLSQLSGWDRDEETNQRMLDLLEEIAYSNWDAYLAESDVLPYLTEGTREYLQQRFPEESLTTREELQTFLQGRLEEFVPEFNVDSIHWDSLTAEGLVMVYHSVLTGAREAYFNPYNDEYMARERNRIARELDFVEDLLGVVDRTPLEDRETLFADLNWEDSESVAAAYLRHQVEYVYDELKVDLPENWEDIQSAVVLANILEHGLERLMHVSGLDSTRPIDNYAEARALYENYHRVAYRTIENDHQTLSGVEMPDIYPLIRFLIGFIPPADLVFTIGEVYHSLAIKGDVGAAANVVLGAVIPGQVSSNLKGVFRNVPGKAIDISTATVAGVIGQLNPGEGQILEAEFADALMKNLYSKVLESDEIPDHWTEPEWDAFMELINPAHGQVTDEALMAALSIGFETQIRQELASQQ